MSDERVTYYNLHPQSVHQHGNRPATRRLIHILSDALTRPLTSDEYIEAVTLLQDVRGERAA